MLCLHHIMYKMWMFASKLINTKYSLDILRSSNLNIFLVIVFYCYSYTFEFHLLELFVLLLENEDTSIWDYCVEALYHYIVYK